jgi:hypothetical protein
MEKYKNALILISIIIGLSVGWLVYANEVAIGEPFVQCEAYGEFDYVKLSNREFKIYLTESNLHDRESLGWVSADYQEIDVIVVVNGIEYERSMFCCKGESSELAVESVNIVVSYYMEENVSTENAVCVGMIVFIITTIISIMTLWTIGNMAQKIKGMRSIQKFEK